MCGEVGEEGVLAENRVHCQLDFRLRFLNRFWNVDMKQLKEPYLQPLKEKTLIHILKNHSRTSGNRVICVLYTKVSCVRRENILEKKY